MKEGRGKGIVKQLGKERQDNRVRRREEGRGRERVDEGGGGGEVAIVVIDGALMVKPRRGSVSGLRG